MKVEDVKLDDLKPYERNPRKNEGAVASVAESIRRFGFKQPIVADADGVIVCGHTRYAAARLLGLRSVPVVRADDLTAQEIKAYRVLDNKLAELSFWDFDALGAELAELDFDFEGFDVDFPSFDLFDEADAAPDSAASAAERSPREDVTADGEEIEDKAGRYYEDELPAPFRWMGAKTRQRDNIYPILDKIQRKGFVEVFGGSGAIMLGKPAEADEVYNDLNCLLVSFFRVLKSKKKAAELRRLCDVTPGSRVFYDECKTLARAFLADDAAAVKKAKAAAELSEAADDVAAAFAVFYCQNFSFGGRLLDSFSASQGRSLTRSYRGKVELLDDFVARFAQVTIEKTDWQDCLKRYDKPDVLLYLDPPYECGSEDAYYTGWNTAETEKLVDALCACKGKVVLSCYDAPEYAKLRGAGFRVKHFHALACVSVKKENAARVETVYYKGSSADFDAIERAEAAENEADAAPKSKRKGAV